MRSWKKADGRKLIAEGFHVLRVGRYPMKNCFRLFLSIIIIAVMMPIGIAAVGRERITKDISVVEDSAFQGHTRRPRVAFRHDAHNEAAAFEYDLCHHVYEDGRLVEGKTPEDRWCSGCHAGQEDPRHLNLVAAYHNRCKGCHEEEKKGPVTCSECHAE